MLHRIKKSLIFSWRHNTMYHIFFYCLQMIVLLLMKLFRSKKYFVIIFGMATILIFFFQREESLEHSRRFIDSRLQEALQLDKGSICVIPKLDPFAKEITQFIEKRPKIKCDGQDWVHCYHSICKVIGPVLEEIGNVKCVYRDVLFVDDDEQKYGPSETVLGEDTYTLNKSDHIKVDCQGDKAGRIMKWSGFTLGFREVKVKHSIPDRNKNNVNVLILAFDSLSKNGFIRGMPKSYKVLTEELKAVILNGYNIVGDGTASALFPILTGHTEWELPDVRKMMGNNRHLDKEIFIFHHMEQDGFETAYFEDMPMIGTFQLRHNGFFKQPTHHYLRPLLLSEAKSWIIKRWRKKFCFGDRPLHIVMMNITDEFFKLDSKKFCLTFISDISHGDINVISTADDEVADFLRKFKEDNHLENTLLIVMGDHGPRYANARKTHQGKLEERLPLMAIVLPEELSRSHPESLKNLNANVNALTTPFDVHSTVLEVVKLDRLMNPYKINGSDLSRSLSLLHRVPINRSCSEAGIVPHWCSCLQWRQVSIHENIYKQAANALVDYINALTQSQRAKCAVRKLTSIEWVQRQVLRDQLLEESHRYLSFLGQPKDEDDYYQVKIHVSPGHAVFEGTMKYLIKENSFVARAEEISRINM